MLKLSVLSITILNIILWPLIHMLVSWFITKLPKYVIPSHIFLFKHLAFENHQNYRKFLQIHKWKDRMPDAAAWFKHGFAKAQLKSSKNDYLQQFCIETVRGELAHWLTLGFAPVFYLWNPFWACMVMTIYAVISNIPCILIQRYNRLRIQQILNPQYKS